MSDGGDTQVATVPSQQQLQRQDDQKQMTVDSIRQLQAEELDKTLQTMKIEDEALRLALDRENEVIQSSIERMHRLNNFRIDEAHVREANVAESRFLVERQEQERQYLGQRQVEEAKTLKDEEDTRRFLDLISREARALKSGVRSRREAGEKVAGVKKRLAERRQAVAMRLASVENRQERERKTLQESQQRVMKNMALYRKLLLQEYEDKELDAFVTNSSEQGQQTKLLGKQEAQKVHEARMLQLKLRMQKEAEQLREEHLLKLKHMTMICDLELEQVDEFENLLADQKIQELELEAEQLKEMEAEQDQANEQAASLKAFQTQRQLQLKAARTISQQRHEARQLQRQQKVAAKQREKHFFAAEEALKESLRALTGDEQDEDAAGSEGGDDGMKGKRSAAQSVGMSEDGSEFSEMTTESELERQLDETAGNDSALQELEAEAKKERERVEATQKKQAEAMETLRIQQREFRESLKREQNEVMFHLLAEQEEEYKQLKIQHHSEMEALLKTQNAANALEADNEVSNTLLYGMLPRYVADELKMGKEVEPKDFECVTILQADIVHFTNLTASSSPQQIVTLLNRLYSGFDETLDDYQDVYKTETVGDAYQIVGGLNSEPSFAARNATEVLECALRFADQVKKLDMTDQIQPELHVRIGVHSGPCVGGVAGVVMPKFAIFGDTVNIAAQMEQKSSPNRVHVSQATVDLVGDAFTFEKRGEVTIEGGVKLNTYWVTGRKKEAATAAAGRSSSAAARRAASGAMDRMGRKQVNMSTPNPAASGSERTST
ncbi:hypothetical protein HK097_010275 [Rhizophlyctis rosea]|uniref:Guanylate cyclase domain-containing protein n=1 Tax=Rhizophlyctis rosea TaxID=64517 RepID=A0AAD5X8V4_9FUNG|nr:hypothetical protein HK097_010275 [Rhizophlyctis rosea]